MKMIKEPMIDKNIKCWYCDGEYEIDYSDIQKFNYPEDCIRYTKATCYSASICPYCKMQNRIKNKDGKFFGIEV
ncbi:MAG: hypothetical protein EOL95_09415 [Bacteroidia bacterium]|nr:hypothetical protein [Bacteroidia bacterium]